MADLKALAKEFAALLGDDQTFIEIYKRATSEKFGFLYITVIMIMIMMLMLIMIMIMIMMLMLIMIMIMIMIMMLIMIMIMIISDLNGLPSAPPGAGQG